MTQLSLSVLERVGRDAGRILPLDSLPRRFRRLNVQNLLSALRKLRRYRDPKGGHTGMAGFDGPDRRAGRWGASREGATQLRRTASTLYGIARNRNDNNNDDDLLQEDNRDDGAR